MQHVAVLLKPYLDLVLAGQKTVECRLTRQPLAPFEQVEPGERIWFKQSAGPFRATAVAGHVIFEDNLTPAKVARLRRDYNDLICGEAHFWKLKSASRYCTLIWLADVQPIDAGPKIRPLQGLAWLGIEDGAIQRPGPPIRARKAADDSFAVQITAGNIRNNTLYVTSVLDRFPAWAVGGPKKRHAAKPVTLVLQDGPSVRTDIVGRRKLVRARMWGRWYRRLGARPGDRVVFTPVDESTYLVALSPVSDSGIHGRASGE